MYIPCGKEHKSCEQFNYHEASTAVQPAPRQWTGRWWVSIMEPQLLFPTLRLSPHGYPQFLRPQAAALLVYESVQYGFFCVWLLWLSITLWEPFTFLPGSAMFRFSLLCSIPLYDYFSICWWIFGLFPNFVLIFGYKTFCWAYSQEWSKWVRHAYEKSALENTSKHFYKYWRPICTPISCEWGFSLFTNAWYCQYVFTISHST